MTVSLISSKVRETGNGAKVAFDFAFNVVAQTDLTVYKIVAATGVATLQTLGADYTVSINTITEGGTVTYTVAPLATEESFILRKTVQDQQSDFPGNGVFNEVNVENELDRSRMIDQELQEQIDRSFKLGETTDYAGSLDIPEAEADAFIGWNAAADALENKTVGDLSAVEKASTADAQAATSDAKYMTPAKVKVTAEYDNLLDIPLTNLADLADMKVVGNTSGGATAPSAVSVLDEDNMASDSDTAIATQQSIKAYADAGLRFHKVSQATVDLGALSSGDQAFTGIGFEPEVIIMMAVRLNDSAMSWCIGDGNTNRGVRDMQAIAANTYDNSANIVHMMVSGSVIVQAIIKTLDSDGFTLTWTVTGSPTGNASLEFLCFG